MYNEGISCRGGETMDDQESVRRNTWDDSTPPQKSLSPYELLMRQSKKLGRAATKTYDVTREFLKQDISSLKPTTRAKPRTNTTDDAKSVRKLDKMVAQSKEVLASAQTVILPNNLFPDTVVVDRQKVTINQKTFFWSSNILSIHIEDILNVSTSTGPLFGSLTISSRVMNSTDHYVINYFWRSDAIRLKRIIQGYMITVHNGVDTSHMPKEELIEKLNELGHDLGA